MKKLLIFVCALVLFNFLPETRAATVDTPNFNSVEIAKSYFKSHPEKAEDKSFVEDKLHYAAATRNLEVVRYLVEEQNADINMLIDPYGTLIDFLAFETKYYVTGKYANTPHKWYKQFEEIIEYLPSKGGRSSMCLKDFIRFHMLDFNSLSQLPKYLINVRSKDGGTVFHYAIMNKTEDIKLMIQQGADIEAPCYSSTCLCCEDCSRTPIQLARYYGNKKAEQALLDAGAQDLERKKKWSPFRKK